MSEAKDGYEALMESWARHLFDCYVETVEFEPLEGDRPSAN